MRHLLSAVIAIVMFGIAAQAQTFRGAINGTVSDPSGAVVADAKVVITNSGTGIAQSSVSTNDGQFSFQDLPLGQYKITVTAGGFPAMTIDKIEVTAGSVYTLPVKLKLGESTVVEVSAAALEVDTTSATQSNTIPAAALQDVPMNGRDFTQFIAVQPGYAGYSVGGFGSLNGTRANQMNWQIDGVDNNDFWHNIPAVNQGGVSGIAGVVMPLDAVDEFSAQSQSNAESGRNAGGIVNLVLKAGTNQLHGSAYYYDRNEAFASASPFTPDGVKKPELRNENYGFSVGGPIFKDKTFYFVSYEKQQYIIGLSGLATEPSDAYQTAALALLSANSVPESSISANLISTLWPSTINNLSATTNNFFSPVASTGYSYNGVIKLDHNFTEKEHFSIRWFGGQGSQTAPLGGSPALATASSNLSYYFEKAPIHVYNYAAVLNSALTPRMSNQILFGVNYFNQTFNDANHSFDTSAMGLDLSPDALIKGQPILGAPNIQISGFEQVGITPPEGRNDITGMLSDILSYNIGKHQFRFGGEVRQGRVDEFYFRHALGKFTFDGTQGPWAGSCAPTDSVCLATISLADFLAGDVSTSGIAVGDAERKVTVNGFDFFGQDDWQITHKLNLNFGLRYDYYGPLHDGSKDLAVFIPAANGIQIQGNGIDSIFPQDKNNFAPRFGFAYQPKEDGDLVVRGGIGIFYDQINMNPFLDFRPPNNADGLEDNPAGPSPVSTYSLNAYTWQANTPIFAGVSTCLTGNVATDPNCGTSVFDVFSVNQNFRTPYFYNYNLNVEKSLGKAAVFQIGYVGSEGRKLSIMLDINQLPNGGTVINPISGAVTTEGRYPQFPNYGGINQLNSIGTSNYNALQTTLKLRSWHGLTSQLSYTWAHELDEISEYRGALPRDSTNLQAEYGNGDFDTRNNFSAFFTYDVPGSSHGPKILTHGWQVTSLMTFHGGQPFDEIRTGQDLIGNPFAGVSHKFSKSGVTWINPAAFAPGATFEGDVRRNQYYGPGFSDVDLSVLKNIPVTERLKIQLRAEMFNVFNRINLASGPGSVSGGIVSDTIGDFNGAPGIGPGEAFNLQLAAKIIF
jgi:hypothetical protein